jgi:predicted nuclease of predicted toxin-antitoxin system
MTFLADENFPAPSIIYLRAKNYHIISIGEDYSSISDEEVLEKAVSEKRIILTFDRDYGELIFKYKKDTPPAIVYFRSKGKGADDAGKILDKYIKAGLVLDGYFTVIQDNAIRQRSLK